MTTIIFVLSILIIMANIFSFVNPTLAKYRLIATYFIQERPLPEGKGKLGARYQESNIRNEGGWYLWRYDTEEEIVQKEKDRIESYKKVCKMTYDQNRSIFNFIATDGGYDESKCINGVYYEYKPIPSLGGFSGGGNGIYNPVTGEPIYQVKIVSE